MNEAYKQLWRIEVMRFTWFWHHPLLGLAPVAVLAAIIALRWLWRNR
jgi:hypothetical protein